MESLAQFMCFDVVGIKFEPKFEIEIEIEGFADKIR